MDPLDVQVRQMARAAYASRQQAALDAAERTGHAVISFGPWEPDPDAPPIYVGLAPGLFGGPLTLRPQTGGWRRRRFASALIDGRTVGRWTWERRPA